MVTNWRRARFLVVGVCALMAMGSRASFEQTLGAIGNYRPWLARFTEQPSYAPCEPEGSPSRGRCGGELPGVVAPRRWRCSPPPFPTSAAGRALLAASEDVFASVAPEEATAPALHRAAVVQLLSRRGEQGVDQAEAWLRQALEITADRPGVLTDLGALELARAQESGGAEVLLRSIELSQHALDEGASGSAARFNLALALSELGITGEARKEWLLFLEREPEGPWAEEGHRRLAALPPADGATRGQDIARRLEAAVFGGEPTLLAEARVDRQRTREWVEGELLSRWARAIIDGEARTATRALNGTRALAEELERLTGDRLLVEAVQAMEQATPAQILDLAHAHDDYAAGLPLLQARRLDAAAARFDRAERVFAAAGSPFVHWATFQRALVHNYQQQPADVETALAALARRVEGRGYAALQGRIHWVRGLATSALGRVEDSNEHYRAAATAFCTAGEMQNLASTQGLLGAGLAKMGHHEAGWNLAASALSLRGEIFSLGRLQAILQDAVFRAHRQGMMRAGLRLADEFVAIAEREGTADDVHSAFMRRAALNEALGRSAAAGADVARAVAALATLSKALSDRGRADGILEEAAAKRLNASAETVARLDSAIKTYQEFHNLQKLPEAHALRAQARLALGRVAGAEEDLLEQARLLEATLFTIAPGPLRQDRLTTLRETFDQMVELQAVVLGDDVAAFRLAEQQRHWALWEWTGGLLPRTQGSPVVADPLAVASMADLLSMGGGDTAVLVYSVLPQHLLIWASAAGKVTLTVEPVRRDEVNSRVAALLDAAAKRDEEALTGSAESLSTALIEPVAAVIAAAPRLVIIPDPLLQAVPFGLLRDLGHRFLYEGHALVYAPSVTAYSRLTASASGRQRGIHRMLAIAATTGRDPGQPPLRAAASEAAAVAAAWPGGTVATFRRLEPLRRRLQSADALHFAGHALVAADGSLRLVVYDDGAEPLELAVATIVGEDASRLRLVSLSGCRTVDVAAAGRIGASSAGFVRSFLAAGVPTVVGSFLELDDRQAGAVFAAFHRRVAAGEDPATALGQACLEQPWRSGFDRTMLCGSLAVFGTSLKVAAGN